MEELTYDPHQALAKAPTELDVTSVRFPRGPQPGYRQPSEQLWDKLAQDIKDLSGSRFAHSYSRLPRGQIRLLVVRPNSFDKPLQLDLLAVPFEQPFRDHPPYEALSYEWGDSPPVHQVTLRDFTTSVKERFIDPKNRLRFILFRALGTRTLIRKNLYNALRHLRHQTDPVKLWVDALCINQPNNDEKADQITRMSEIYNQAYNVRIWLGGASRHSDEAMDFLLDILRFDYLKDVLRRQESLNQYGALIELMRSRWFGRRWVIQELALARRASVYCGTKKVTWDDFRGAIAIFILKLPKIREEFEHSEKVELKPEGLNAVEAFGARALVRAYTDLLQKDDDGNILDRRKTLEDLVSNLVSFDSADPRDTVYALLAIARNDPQKQLKPDYNKSLLEVHTEFIKYCVETSGTLDMICRHWAPANTTLVIQVSKNEKRRFESNLPSWIRQLGDSAFGTPEKIFRGRKNADSLVGTQRIYNASGRHSVELARFGKKPALGGQVSESSQEFILTETFDGSLTVRGLKLGTISSVSPRMIPGLLPQEVLAMGGWSHSLKDEDLRAETVPDRLWRTLVANKDIHGHSPEGDYKFSCLYVLQKEDVSGDVRMNEIMADPSCPEHVSSFLRRVQDVIWNRRAFIGGSNDKLFGLCPKGTQENDFLCILYGCSVPVVLRQLDIKPQLGLKPDTNNIRAQGEKPKCPPTAPGPSEPPQTTMAATADDTSAPHAEENPWAEADASKSPNTRDPLTDTSKHSRQESPEPPPESAESLVDSSKDPASDGPEVVSTIYYKLVGECYIDGRMDGEAIDNVEYMESEQDFTLV